jgi:hypothetical protein
LRCVEGKMGRDRTRNELFREKGVNPKFVDRIGCNYNGLFKDNR